MPAGLTPSNQVAALLDLDLSAVALCNEGANSRAHIMLIKRKENNNMTYDELMKALNPEQQAIITAKIKELEVANESAVSELNKSITTLTGEVEVLSKSKDTGTSEDILKSASPEIKAMVEKLQGTVNSLVTSQEESLAKERFTKVKALPVPEDELKTVLKSASPAVISILEKAAAAIEAGLVAKGSDAAGDVNSGSADEAYSRLEKAARTIMTESAGITFEKAFTKACEVNADVYKTYTKGVK